jgi:hypothetical protein
MSKEDKLWQYIKSIYKDKLGIPEEICNFLSVDVILVGVITGLSVTHIANYVNIDEKLIRVIIKEYFKEPEYFNGWNGDLDFSPIMVYNRVNNLEEYMNEAELISPLDTTLDKRLGYELCKQYKNYEEELAKYGYVTR